jgi:hypothetical protein
MGAFHSMTGHDEEVSDPYLLAAQYDGAIDGLLGPSKRLEEIPELEGPQGVWKGNCSSDALCSIAYHWFRS